LTNFDGFFLSRFYKTIFSVRKYFHGSQKTYLFQQTQNVTFTCLQTAEHGLIAGLSFLKGEVKSAIPVFDILTAVFDKHSTLPKVTPFSLTKHTI